MADLTKEELNLTLLVMESYLLESRFIELGESNPARIYKQDVKRLVNLQAKHATRLCDMLQPHVPVNLLDTQNVCVNDFMTLHNLYVSFTPEERVDFMEDINKIVRLKNETVEKHESN